MGYSGAIYCNDISLHNEKKGEGQYCMDYAEAYNKQKSAKLSTIAIEETIKNINGGVNSYSSVMHSIVCAGDIIHSLSSLLDSGYRSFFDENGNFLLVSKLQYSDKYRNKECVNFYEKDRLPDVQETECASLKGTTLSEEYLEKIKRKRVAYIETLNIFTTLNKLSNCLSNYRDVYDTYIEDLLNIKTRSDVFDLLAQMNKYYDMLNEIYHEKYNFAMKLTPILEKCKDMLNSGKDVFVKCKENTLYIYTSEQYAQIDFECFFDIADLFSSIGTSTGSSSCLITTLEDFEILLNSFSTVKYRSSYIEKILKGQYEKFKRIGQEFKLSIYGGY